MPATVIVPAAPALVPSVSGHAPELDEVRAAALTAVTDLVATAPMRVVVVADARAPSTEAAIIDLSGFGIPSGPAPGARLPVEFVTGAWLLDEAGWTGAREYRPCHRSTSVEAGDAVVVIADGSSCRSLKSPGYLDERAAGFDARIEAALAAGDGAALLRLDGALAAELGAAGLPALRWLGMAAAAVTTEVVWAGAPLGVGMWVARG